jgi:UPF0755 protein
MKFRFFLLGGVFVAGLGAAALYAAAARFDAPGPLAAPRDVVVPHGGLAAAADALLVQGVIGDTAAFKVAAFATYAEGPIHAAELLFPAHASLRMVLAVLREGHAVQHKVTIAEGLTAAQIAGVLARTEALAGDVPVPREGLVLPETYAFERGASSQSVLSRGAAAMRGVLDAAWAGRAPGLPLRTPEDALVLASVVEREAKLPAERPMIARVFLNRLALGMKLQADPTAAYGASGGLGHLDRKLEHADLERADAYNTYYVGGLPAGPICSPGAASIRAVLHPADGNALYFVADGTGGHLFTDHLATQTTNIIHLRGMRR